MIAPSNYTEWLIRVLAFVGGAGSTVVGSWISSKIRLYHDNQKSHHQELKQKVLLPFRDLLAQHQALFEHQIPVVVEKWGRLQILDARPDQDDFEHGAFLQSENPWLAAFSAMDRALLEDARRVHYKKLMAEISALASSWKAHTENCSIWIMQIGTEVLIASEMNPYGTQRLLLSSDAQGSGVAGLFKHLHRPRGDRR